VRDDLFHLESATLARASELWDYLSSFASVGRADAIVVCCSYDLRVCDHACDLVRAGVSKQLVLSGNTGNWTKHLWNRPEAHVFRDRAIANGISPGSVLIEDGSTNFGENIRFSRAALPEAKSVVFVTKPAAVLRVKLTVEAQWPEIKSYVTCPELAFPADVSRVIGVLGVVHEMVGDIQRIQRYHLLGYQVPHEFPKRILDAWQGLIDGGFTHHLLPIL
jgi:uncharacterized SAM-binding protein YcdF (DUF218 family)